MKSNLLWKGMSNMHGHPLLGSSIPSQPIITATSKRTFDVGYAHNGVHIPDHQHITTELIFYRGPGWVCESCGKPIKTFDIIAKPPAGDKSFTFCLDCITVDEAFDGVPFNYCYVKIKLRRKSSNHPYGYVERFLVCTHNQFIAYEEALKKSGYPIMEFQFK